MIYVGVDGGGTKTKLMLYEDDHKRAETIVGPVMIDKEFLNTSIKNVTNGIDLLFEISGLSKTIDSLYLGLSGNANIENITIFKNALQHQAIMTKTKVFIENDIHCAYEAACSGRPSIALIIGTGSVGFAMNELGQTHRVGGVNMFEGDLGSGYDIGMKTLRYLSKCFDGRLEKSPMMNKMLEEFKISNYQDLSKLFYEYAQDRTKTASIAKLTYQYLISGDLIAYKIFDEAALDILDIVMALSNHFKGFHKEIGIIGGLGNQPLYFKMIKDKILNFDSNYWVHSADLDPCLGAVNLAKKYYLKSKKDS